MADTKIPHRHFPQSLVKTGGGVLTQNHYVSNQHRPRPTDEWTEKNSLDH